MDRKNILFIRIPPWFGIKNHHPREIVLPFSIGYAAAQMLKEGMNVNVIDMAIEKISVEGIVKQILMENPDFVVMDCRLPAAHIAKSVADKVKDFNKNIFFIIFGQDKIKGFDACITDELEFSLPSVINHLQNNSCIGDKQGMNYENKLIEDLDYLPCINYSLFKLTKYQKKSVCAPVFGRNRWGFILSSRGCPYDCIFCSPITRTSIGKSYRTHSSGWIADEVERLIRDHGVNAISFEDDNFAFDKNRVEQICDDFIRRNIKVAWTARTRIDLLDENLLGKMKRAGCFSLGIGVESGNNRILGILKKGQQREKIIDTIMMMERIRIAPLLFLIIGNPTETLEEMQQTFELAKRLRPVALQFHYFTIYPGSEIYNVLRGNSFDFKEISHYDNCRYNLSAVPDVALKKVLKEFYIKYYLSLGYFCKYIRYRLPYVIFDINEMKLILDTFRFLFKHEYLNNE